MKNDRILYIRTQTHKVTIYNTPKGCVVGSLLRRKIYVNAVKIFTNATAESKDVEINVSCITHMGNGRLALTFVVLLEVCTRLKTSLSALECVMYRKKHTNRLISPSPLNYVLEIDFISQV